MDQAGIMGIMMDQPQRFITLPVYPNTQQHIIFNSLKDKFQSVKDYDLIIVIFSDRVNHLYATVKEVAELNVGCLTQCFLSKHLTNERRPISNNLSTVTNLLLKINAKLNGVNHKLVSKPQFLKGHVMVMGADVTHPSPQNKNKLPSFAAVTASHDTDFFKYNYKCQIQTREMIEDLSLIVLEQLEYNFKTTGMTPDHIIVFRDGISEGDFDNMRQSEVKEIKQACAKFGTKNKKKYTPKITFIVVMKRHHTRFFPTDARDAFADRKFLNIPAGTCVDNGITHPKALNFKDFYLASHAAIQGVTKPAKYCTIYDDANLSYDDIEEFAYYLCHMYSRCARSVSYPAPTYYAHLAAERTKKFFENQDMKPIFSRLQREKRIPIDVKIANTNPMSFV